MVLGEFTLECAGSAKSALEEIFDSIPTGKKTQLAGQFNEVFLFVGAAIRSLMSAKAAMEALAKMGAQERQERADRGAFGDYAAFPNDPIVDNAGTGQGG